MTPVWQQYFNLSVIQPLNQTPQQFASIVDLTDQAASIVSTPIPLPSLTAGLYRISIFARITQVGTVSSSLVVTMSATDDGVSYTLPTTALTTNLVTSVTSQTWVMSVDRATPISYSTTYASTGAQAMQYKLRILVEALPT